VKTGALLSGGLDSSAITVVAQEMLSDRFSSYSVVSDHKKYSEAGFINLLVKEKGIENYQLSLEPEKMLGMLDKVIEHQDEPFAGMSMVAQYQIFQKIKQETDVTVVLSGQGGDEILMGYLKFYFFYLQKLRRDGAYLQMLKELFASLIHRTMLWQFDFAHAKRYLPGKAGAAKTYQLYTYSPESTWMANDIRERQIADIERFSVPALAHYEDRNSMAWSIESRLPFMDHRLVNFMLNVAESEKIRNGWSKYLLRKSMHELPDAIRWRRDKKGFTLPEEVWTRTTLRGEIMSAFKQSQLDALGLIDAQKLMEAYQAYLTGKPSMHYSEILRIFIAEKWAKQHFA
jgi:asparagine synthase (glutamine-hydrolysing)